jgi:hypothetical protein
MLVHRRWRETITHFLVLFAFLSGLIFIGVICILIVRDPGASSKRFQWAAASLSAILAGATGFLAGKSRS